MMVFSWILGKNVHFKLPLWLPLTAHWSVQLCTFQTIVYYEIGLRGRDRTSVRLLRSEEQNNAFLQHLSCCECLDTSCTAQVWSRYFFFAERKSALIWAAKIWIPHNIKKSCKLRYFIENNKNGAALQHHRDAEIRPFVWASSKKIWK